MKMKTTLISFTLLFIAVNLAAQTPDFYPPTDSDPVVFDLLNIFLYIILPLLLIGAFLLYRWSKKKKAREKQEEKNNQKE